MAGVWIGGSGKRPVKGFCEYGNEFSDYIMLVVSSQD
jgi:hypothetical protein